MTDEQMIEKLAKWVGAPNERVVYDDTFADEDNNFAVWWFVDGSMSRPWRPDKFIEDAWMLVEKMSGEPREGKSPEDFKLWAKWMMFWHDRHKQLYRMSASEAARAISEAVLGVIE